LGNDRPTQIELTLAADEYAARVYRARQRGQTLKQIGAVFGISIERARQLSERGQYVMQLNDDPINELSTRVRNVLHENKCGRTPVKVSQWFAAQPARYIRSIPNFGAGSRKELRDWLLRHKQRPSWSESAK
jgi:hypothetical protein